LLVSCFNTTWFHRKISQNSQISNFKISVTCVRSCWMGTDRQRIHHIWILQSLFKILMIFLKVRCKSKSRNCVRSKQMHTVQWQTQPVCVLIDRISIFEMKISHSDIYSAIFWAIIYFFMSQSFPFGTCSLLLATGLIVRWR